MRLAGAYVAVVVGLVSGFAVRGVLFLVHPLPLHTCYTFDSRAAVFLGVLAVGGPPLAASRASRRQRDWLKALLCGLCVLGVVMLWTYWRTTFCAPL